MMLTSDWNVRDHVPLEKFIIQSHRGAGDLAPENTLEAFELAWEMGTWPEADLRMTRDGVIVTFHDADFSRVVKGVSPDMAKKGVADITWAELSKLDVGAWKGSEFTGRRVTRIGDALALMTDHPDRRMYLDIKNVDLPQLAREVKAHRVEPQVVLASTKYEIIREWKSLIPESQTLLWMGAAEEVLQKRIDDLKKTTFADVTQLQIHIHPTRMASDQFLLNVGKEVHSRGILFQALPYDTTERGVYWRLMDLGVESFATDHPQLMEKLLKEYYADTRRK